MGNLGAFYNATINATGGTGQLTWSSSAGLPSGLTLPPQVGAAAGIGGTPTAKGTFTFTVTVSDTAGASASKMLSVTIGPPLPLTVTTTSANLPSGTVNLAYGAGLGATGGVQPYAWSLAAGSVLPSNLTMDSSGGISGTPTAFGKFTFTVMVSDSETPALTATANLSITINTLLFGQYSFVFNGFDANGAVAAAGSFTADGQGGITGGVEDINRHAPGPATNVSITGTYSIGTDNRGTLTFTSSLGTSTFAVAVNSGPFNFFPGPGGVRARFVELDSSGTRGSGVIVGNQGPCALNSIVGDLALGISGDDLNRGRVAIAGRFHADGAGNLSGGLLDGNDAGTLSSNITWTGIYAASANSSPRCTATFAPTGLPSLNFAVYPPFLVQVDSLASGVPLTAGTILSQTGAGTFTNASLSAPSVGGLTGFSVAAGAPDVSLVFLSPDGKGNVTITQDENKGGVVTTGTVLMGTYNVSSEGRVTLTTGNNPLVLYLVSGNFAFVVGTDDDATFGFLEMQGGLPLSNAALAGNFFSGTVTPASANVSDLSGVVTIDGGSAFSGTSDESTPATNIADQIFSGTYSVTNTPLNGHGTLAMTPTTGPTANFFFLIAAPKSCGRRGCSIVYTRVVAIPSDATQTNPAVLVLEK
jgi:hypothetical protein